MSRPQPTKFGARIKKLLAESPIGYSYRVDMVNYLGLLNEWRKEHASAPYFENRSQLYDYLADKVLGNTPIAYLEFGVFKGESIAYWSKVNQHPDSQFVGFDTFEGLPESWKIYTGELGKGHFDVKGQLPNIKDPRVRFLKGLFQDTLPGFLETFSPAHRLVINNDSDLHSSTLFTLCSLHRFLKPDTIIIFDEFSQVLDEFRAFRDYYRAFRRQYRVLGSAGQYYDRVAIAFK